MTKKNVLQVPVPKGDASWCETCKANTIYNETCAVCGIPTIEAQERYSGRYWDTGYWIPVSVTDILPKENKK